MREYFWTPRTLFLSTFRSFLYLFYFFKKREVLHMVVKAAVTNAYLVKVFQPSITFVKETQFYSNIIPAIERLEIELNINSSDRLDAFIGCIGSRISLDPGMAEKNLYFLSRTRSTFM